MGKELYESNAAARAVFDAVDDALGEKLSEIIFNGPTETLTLTANVQPAIFAVSLAILKSNPNIFDTDVKFVAGHSLGEYSALCAAGAIGIADTAQLLRLRGKSMQQAVPVGMGMVSVIIGLDATLITEICRESGAQMANDNGANQFVISGLAADVEKAMEIAKSRGARRAMQLPLSAPVHCSLQLPTADIMADALSNIEIKAPTHPLISNKTTLPMSEPDEIRDALVYQITHGVRWRESVTNMPDFGITKTIEVGPGSALTGMVQRITDKITAEKIG
jgi:[acyl-carrier-protein] S-malonyltransferase